MEFILISEMSNELIIEDEKDILKDEKYEEIIENIFLSENDVSYPIQTETKINFQNFFELYENCLFNINSIDDNNTEKIFISKKKKRKQNEDININNLEVELSNNNELRNKLTKRIKQKVKILLEKLLFNEIKNNDDNDEILLDEDFIEICKSKQKNIYENYKDFKNDKSNENNIKRLLNEKLSELEELEENIKNNNEKMIEFYYFNNYINNIKHHLNKNIKLFKLSNKFNNNTCLNILNSNCPFLGSTSFENGSKTINNNNKMIMDENI